LRSKKKCKSRSEVRKEINYNFWRNIHEFQTDIEKIHRTSTLSILKTLITQEFLRGPVPIFVCIMAAIGKWLAILSPLLY